MVMAYRFDAQTMLSLIERHGCTSTVAAITATSRCSIIRRSSQRSSSGSESSSVAVPRCRPDLVNRWEARHRCVYSQTPMA